VHPLFNSKKALFFYLAAWIPLGKLLSIAAGLSWQETALVTLLLAFVAMSPWYSCKGLPLATTPLWRLALHQTAAVIVASSLLLLAARVLAATPGQTIGNLPALAGMISLIYILSIAVHYAVLNAQASRESEILARAAELRP